MRVNRFALAISLCAGLAMFGGRAHAGIGGATSDLIDGDFSIISSQEPNTQTECLVGAEGSDFFVEGSATGMDGAVVVVVSYFTPQPTSVTRKTQSLKVKQGTFSELEISFDGGGVGPGLVEKCSVSGSVNTKKATGSITVDCKSDDIFGVLSAAQATSLQAAFASSKTVKVKLNSSKGKGSISIKCKGDLGIL